ncbi:MAG: zinc ribbon domain-containing protein [Gemmatimonadaceae bacterium]
MIELLLGTALALGALAFVLAPLFMEERVSIADTAAAPDGSVPVGEASAVEALREIEFDRATGKLSDADYSTLKASYTARAVEAMRAVEGSVASSVTSAPADAALSFDSRFDARERRTIESDVAPRCPSCGPRPQPDARYCSDCGRFLTGECGACGAAVTEPGARFCGDCGATLAA